MKCLKFNLVAAALAAIAFSGSLASAQNLLVDPSFEGTLTFDGPPFVGTWEGFNNGGPNTSAFTTNMPRTGNQSLELNLGDPNGFAGAFQDVLAAAGTTATFSVWHKDVLGTNGAGIEMRMEFRDSVGNTEISRTGNMTPASLGSEYEQFGFSAVVPAGADTIRAVYAIQSFGAAPPQKVFVDDASVTVIPEPASFALLGLASVALLSSRRRSL